MSSEDDIELLASQLAKGRTRGQGSVKKNELSRDMINLYDWLAKKGAISTYSTNETESLIPGRENIVGAFYPDTKKIVLQPTESEPIDEIALHEGIHSLQYSDRVPSRLGRAYADIVAAGNDSDFQKLTIPSHWVTGQMEEQLPSKADSEAERAQGALAEYLHEMSQESRKKRQEAFSSFASSRGKKPEDYGNPEMEADAYYLSDPSSSLGDFRSRAKQVALRLRDKGVPWEIVEPLYKRLLTGESE